MKTLKYRAKQSIEAAQWTGSNLDEMKTLLEPYIEGDEEGPYVDSEYIEEYFLRGLNRTSGGYNMLKFYAGDDMEVDPGQWVVCYDDGEVEIMCDEQFNRMFELS